MKCKRARKMLVEYVNGFLGSEDSRLVQEHVEKCESCRQELDMLEKVLKLIDDVKIEYPPASVWESYLPDLHRRIESEAALAFQKQHRRRFYFLPGWAVSAAVVLLILFTSVMLRYYSPNRPERLQKVENIEMLEDTSPPIVEVSSEPVLIAEVISKVLITEAEAAQLKELKSFTQSETLTSLYYYDDILSDTSSEVSDAKNDEGVIQFLLENEFAEFDESSMTESDSDEFGTNIAWRTEQ